MKRFIHSLRNAMRGLSLGIKSEQHLKVHAVASILVCLAGIYFSISRMEWVVLFLAIGIVWTAELLNTSIERLANHVTTESHPKIRDIKDISAGAVLFAVFSAIAVGLVIFVPKTIEKFSF
jgi:diacylglycerol kinase